MAKGINQVKIDRSPYFCGLLAVVALATGIDATAQDHAGHRPGAPEHDLTKKMTLFPQSDASGTGWQPDVTPMNAVHRDLGVFLNLQPSR